MDASLNVPLLASLGCLSLVDQGFFFNPSRSVWKSVNNPGEINLTFDEVKGIKCVKLASLKGFFFFFPRVALWEIRCVQFIYSQRNINCMDTKPLTWKKIRWCCRLANFFFFIDFLLKNRFYFIYFWLHWVFVAARGLSLVVASRGYSSLWCVGFSLWWLLVAEHGL